VEESLRGEKSDEEDKTEGIGPVLTFCLSKSKTDPPLLWKVELPAPSSLSKVIAVETILVLDGKLTTQLQANHANNEEYKPTHIYINGFQSWSFLGSVVQGCHQPVSAMPAMFN